MAILAIASIRDVLRARRLAMPWRGKAMLFLAALILGIAKATVPRDPAWIDWVVLPCCLVLALIGLLVNRREERHQLAKGGL
jgi:peptidoglycan/LPS O-acetylase OafA/YrhL